MIGRLDFIQEANVYGVPVPGMWMLTTLSVSFNAVTVFPANAVGGGEARDAAEEEGTNSETVAEDWRNASVL